MSNQQKNQGNIIAIITMIFLFGMISFVTNLAAPMGVVLKEQFGVSNFEGMLGNAMNFIAYAIMGIPGGFLLQRIGYKKTAIVATIVGFVGVGIQFLSGNVSEGAAFSVYLLGALVAGFSMTLLNTVVNPMLNTLGGGGNKGNQLIQIGGSFNSLMATITPAFIGILIGSAVKAQISDVFPVLYIAMGIFAFATIALFILNIPEPSTSKTTESMGSLLSGALKFRHFVLGAVAICAYIGVEVGVPATLNLWLSDTPSVGKVTAGFVAGTYWALMLVGRLVGASIGSKVSSKTMLTTASAVGLILVALAIFIPASDSNMIKLPVLMKDAAGSLSFGLAEVYINAMFLVLVGLCTSIMWGGIFNLAVEGLGKYLTAASGIFMTMVCGGGLIPAFQGWVADVTGYQASYWVVFVCLGFLLYYALIGCKNVNKDIAVD